MAAEEDPPEVMTFDKLTDDEKAVLRECRVNSIYFRGVPFGAISVLIMRGGVQTGIFAIGFLAGVASYRKTCLNKIMRLENSPLAEKFRSLYGKAGMNDEVVGEESGFSGDDHRHSEAGDEAPSYIHANRDDTNPSGSSWTMPSPLGHQDDQKHTDKFTSYEELRRRNRNQWMNTGKQKTSSSTPPQQSEEEGELLRSSDDYHSASDSYQADHSSALLFEDDPTPVIQREDQKTFGRGKRTGSGRAPMKNTYGDVLEK